MMRRHELDPVSLTFGFGFAGLGLLFLLGRADEALRLRWVWPLLLFALGVGILLDLARPGRRTSPDTTDLASAPARPDPDSADAADRDPDSLDEDQEDGPAVDTREHPD